MTGAPYRDGLGSASAPEPCGLGRSGAIPSANTYRGWTITYAPTPIPIRGFDWVGTSPNFDASYEGEEDGWVGNGEQVHAATREALIEEIDAWFEEDAQ